MIGSLSTAFLEGYEKMEIQGAEVSANDIDPGKIDEAVLALLWLNLRESGVAWKGMAWATMERLHEQGLIDDPVSKRKSVEMTGEGRRKAETAFRKLFVSGPSCHS